jgi:restriction system protein
MRRFKIEREGTPDLPAMMLATVEALRDIGGSATIAELDEKVIETEGVTEDEQQIPMSGADPRLRVNYYLAWCRTYLRRGGVLENSARGVWSLMEGAKSITSTDDTEAIYQQVQKEEREKARLKRLAEKNQKKERQDQREGSVHVVTEGVEEDTTASDWKEELLQVLRSIDPSAFERLAQRLLRESGFTKVEVRGKSGDGGIDGVGVLRVNLVSFQVFFQCKRYKGSVSASEIRDFRGAMQGRADKGLFITTGSFTAQASDEATRDGATAIDLIDGPRLCELLKENRLGVSTEMIEQVNIQADWFRAI